jgi:hypothetical protein
MTAAQAAHVIPFASAMTLLTCANAGMAISNISNAGNQIHIRRFISQSLLVHVTA